MDTGSNVDFRRAPRKRCRKQISLGRTESVGFLRKQGISRIGRADGFLVICWSVDVEMEGSDRKFALLITAHRHELLDSNTSAARPLPTSMYGTTLKSSGLPETAGYGTNGARYGLASVASSQNSHANVEPARANQHHYARHRLGEASDRKEPNICVASSQQLLWSFKRHQRWMCRVASRSKHVLV